MEISVIKEPRVSLSLYSENPLGALRLPMPTSPVADTSYNP